MLTRSWSELLHRINTQSSLFALIRTIIPDMPHKTSTAFTLTTAEKAAFSVTSRLLSCIVTESLLRGVFLALDSPKAVGLCIVLYSDADHGESNLMDRINGDSNVFCVIPLRHKPILKLQHDAKRISAIGLIDPMDMLSCVFDCNATLSQVIAHSDDWKRAITSHFNGSSLSDLDYKGVEANLDPLHYWKKLTDAVGCEPELANSIGVELLSSQQWQLYVYQNPHRYLNLEASSIEWEQSLIEGHPTHPMHRARRTTPPMQWINPGEYDYYRPNIRLVAVPRSKMQLHPDFERLLAPFYEAASRNACKPLPTRENMFMAPAHELQLVHIQSKFDDVEILGEEFSVPALAQSSIRSVVILDVLPNLSLKLPVGVKITSALRTISHWTAEFGPRFSKAVVPKLSYDRKILIIEDEPAGMVYVDPEPERQKHFTALLRNAYENDSERHGERVIVCASLVERDPHGVAAICHLLNLNSRQKRLDYLDRYVRLLFQALLPPMMINGVGFEAHPQNMLARFNIKTGKLKGFVIRDLGGLRIHGPTLDASIGEHFEFLPGHCIPTDTIEAAFKKLYHTLFHNHLQRLVRVLDLHHDGSGWEIVRKYLREMIPQDHALYRAWLAPGSEFISGKCLLRMKLEGKYRDNVYHSMPNMIHCKPDDELMPAVRPIRISRASMGLTLSRQSSWQDTKVAA